MGESSKFSDITSNFGKRNILPKYFNYQAVSKFKSIRRAIRRGRIDLYTGMILPKRFFNNRKSTNGRAVNNLKKSLYGQYLRKAI